MQKFSEPTIINFVIIKSLANVLHYTIVIYLSYFQFYDPQEAGVEHSLLQGKKEVTRHQWQGSNNNSGAAGGPHS
jgi:hypothetical protein